MNACRRMLCLGALAVTLGGCATAGRPSRDGQPVVLRLSPASLGRELSLQQRMTVTSHGRSQQLDVAIEADADAVRMAFMAFGQTVARLEWDGRELREQRAPGWPAVVAGAGVLSDLQLIHWPPEAIRAALPAGWRLLEAPQERTLTSGEAAAVRVRYPSPGVTELDNLAAGYQLRLETAGESP